MAFVKLVLSIHFSMVPHAPMVLKDVICQIKFGTAKCVFALMDILWWIIFVLHAQVIPHGTEFNVLEL
jgi:hypothetical protein